MKVTERSVAWILFAIISTGGVVLALLDPGGGDDRQSVDTSAAATTTEAGGGRSFTLAATGDIIVHESVAAAALTDNGYDFRPMFAAISPIIRDADLALCHVESPLSADNTDLAYYPAFRVPFEIADAIVDAGYDGCSVASNHSLDSGPASVEPTVGRLRQVGLGTTGMATDAAMADELRFYDAGGVRVGHLSYAYGVNSGVVPDQPWLVNIIDEAAITAEAHRLREGGAEVIVASLHWGIEYDAVPTAEQSTLAARLLASPDIDLIIGHHAHVIQALALVDGKYVAYGLGNILSNQSPTSCGECPAGTQDGVIMEFHVVERDNGVFEVDSTTAIPTLVTPGTFVIQPSEGDDPTLAASAARTEAALGTSPTS